ncbi:MAG TPA: carboxylating nicotinate-nucleotide diphosphorylase [Leucothrix mucor]|nr:carboxylating nicotinate-nucleotide diphosphorylase [Leucothrix mucor]
MSLSKNIIKMVGLALEEDIGSGDVTADLIDAKEQSTATVICRDEAILSGKAWFDEVFTQIDKQVSIEWNYNDGDSVKANSILCTLSGNSRALLSGERAALNFLQTLSATATLTNQYVKRVEGTNARILDTRKTLPNLRLAQKYAVTCGGGKNHRIALYDMILIKENHIMAAGSITQAIAKARRLHPDINVEVETENMLEFAEASKANADIIMLDNYSLDDMRTAVKLNEDSGIKLEASGGINMQTVRPIAETGVDYISVGEITKDIKAVDLSMRFQVAK